MRSPNMDWLPNLTFLSHTGSFLIFEWLIFIFDHFTHYLVRYANISGSKTHNNFYMYLPKTMMIASKKMIIRLLVGRHVQYLD